MIQTKSFIGAHTHISNNFDIVVCNLTARRLRLFTNWCQSIVVRKVKDGIFLTFCHEIFTLKMIVNGWKWIRYNMLHSKPILNKIISNLPNDSGNGNNFQTLGPFLQRICQCQDILDQKFFHKNHIQNHLYPSTLEYQRIPQKWKMTKELLWATRDLPQHGF